MKYATKLMVLPYMPKLENPEERYMFNLDAEMSKVLRNRKLSIDQKVKLYSSALERFRTKAQSRDIPPPSIEESKSRVVEEVTRPTPLPEPAVPEIEEVLTHEAENIPTLQNHFSVLTPNNNNLKTNRKAKVKRLKQAPLKTVTPKPKGKKKVNADENKQEPLNLQKLFLLPNDDLETTYRKSRPIRNKNPVNYNESKRKGKTNVQENMDYSIIVDENNEEKVRLARSKQTVSSKLSKKKEDERKAQTDKRRSVNIQRGQGYWLTKSFF